MSFTTGSLLIKGGRVIDPGAGLDGLLDVRIVDGKVQAVAAALQPLSGEQVVDAAGCYVTPGWIDLHVHFREPGFEYKETIQTGSESAVAGGWTTVLAMANTEPVNDNPAITKYMLDRSAEIGLCRLLPVGAATKGLAGEELAEIGQMIGVGAAMISDDGRPVMSAGVQRKVFEYCKSFNVPVSIHAEDLSLTSGGCCNEGLFSTKTGLRGMPNVAEDVMITRDIALARLTGAHLHVAHLSTLGAVEAVRAAKKEGLHVTAEAAPHHLTLTDKEILRYDTNFKMNPPLRSETDRQAVIAALADGTIDVVATDHAPHALSEKDVEFSRAPNGIVGLESALPLLLELVRDGKLTLRRMVESVTVRPAEIINRADLGTLKPGNAGDVTVFDPDESWVFDKSRLRSKSKNSPFEGRPMVGRLKATIFDGRLVYKA
jgi:dihydroorotase